MSGGIRVWPDGDGIGRIVDKLEKIDPDGSWEAVYVEAIATYLGVSARTVKVQLASRRRLRASRVRATNATNEQPILVSRNT